ncbi:MAG: EcsC family protein [Fibromonadaceae bacterium]|jgi:uncharacterized protein (DUF697 family)|nr:EcsC family protein [Fibromonadaceae bacterium]
MENKTTENFTEAKVMQALDFAYERAISGFTGIDSAIQLAEHYKREYPNSKQEQVNALIRWQIAKSATSGFITGFGGFVVLPATIPANLASVLFIQLRMIIAIAIIGGHSPRDEKVRTLAQACLAENEIRVFLKEAGLSLLKEAAAKEFGKKIALNAVMKNLTADVMLRITRLVSAKILAKFGTASLSKFIPVIGGIIGGAIDGVWTKKISKNAKKLFIEDIDA